MSNAAKASPIEHELVCPNGHVVELSEHLNNGVPTGMDRPMWCEWCFDAVEMRHLVRSGRTRTRQFSTYPKAEPFR